MTNQTPKKKKRNIDRELRLGGCAVLLMFPIVFYAFITSLSGFISIINSLINDIPVYGGLTEIWLKILLGLPASIFLIIGIKFIMRFRTLYLTRHMLKAEQARVATLFDTHSAIDRLQDHDLSDDVQQKSPIKKLNRGSKSSF